MSVALPRVMVGCPVRDRAWILPDYLEHLYGLDYPKELLTLCFVLNDSTDGSQGILEDFRGKHQQEYRGVKLVTFDQGAVKDLRNYFVRLQVFPALARVRNEFLGQLTDEDYLFSVDSDVLVPPNALRDLLACGKDIVAAQIWNHPTKLIPNFLDWAFSCYLHRAEFPAGALIEVDVTGAVYLLSRSVVQDVRYGYHLQGEDVFFCEQARRKGYRIWVDTGVYCEHVMTPEMLSRQRADREGGAC